MSVVTFSGVMLSANMFNLLISVTRLGNFLPIGLLLDAHYDFLKI